MEFYTSTVNKYISIKREYQKNMSDSSRKNGVMDQERYRKWAIQHKWTEHEYHVQDIKHMLHRNIKYYVIQPSLLVRNFQRFLYSCLYTHVNAKQN